MTLLPSPFVAQPKVSSAGGQPGYISRTAIEQARDAKVAVHLPNMVTTRRWRDVGLVAPTGEAWRIAHWVMAAGDRRYWSWAARRSTWNGSIRRSLEDSLCADKDNINKGLAQLRRAKVIDEGRAANRDETLTLNMKWRLTMCEIDWRWRIRHALPGLEDAFVNVGWGVISQQVDDVMAEEGLDPHHQRDIVRAMRHVQQAHYPKQDASPPAGKPQLKAVK